MTGLLDFFQQDPDKQAALKQGLLNMGIQMLAGGRQELGTSLGQGLGAGVSVYQKQLDDMKKKQAMQSVFRSAYGQPPAQAPVVMKPQEAAAPAAPMYGGKAPLLSMDYANGSDLAQEQPQAQPQQEQAPAPQFDRNAFFRAAFENPDAGFANTALESLLKPGPEGVKPQLVERWNPDTQQVEKGWMTPGGRDFVPVGLGTPKGESDKLPNKAQEYEYAVRNGYKGSFTDYVKIVPEAQAAFMYPFRRTDQASTESHDAYNLPPSVNPQRPAQAPQSFTVQAPDGNVYTFPNKKAADSFRRQIGVK